MLRSQSILEKPLNDYTTGSFVIKAAYYFRAR